MFNYHWNTCQWTCTRFCWLSIPASCLIKCIALTGGSFTWIPQVEANSQFTFGFLPESTTEPSCGDNVLYVCCICEALWSPYHQDSDMSFLHSLWLSLLLSICFSWRVWQKGSISGCPGSLKSTRQFIQMVNKNCSRNVCSEGSQTLFLCVTGLFSGTEVKKALNHQRSGTVRHTEWQEVFLEMLRLISLCCVRIFLPQRKQKKKKS